MYNGSREGGIAWDSLMTSDRADEWLNFCAGLFEKKIDGQEFAGELARSIG